MKPESSVKQPITAGFTDDEELKKSVWKTLSARENHFPPFPGAWQESVWASDW